VIENHSDTPRRVRVELRYAADFADLFEVKDGTSPKGSVGVVVHEAEVELSVDRAGQHRLTRLVFSAQGGELFEDHACSRSSSVLAADGRRASMCSAASMSSSGDRGVAMVGSASSNPRCR
jgi:hypothetical protein